MPQVTWVCNPAMTIDVTSTIPNPDEYANGNDEEKKSAIRALEYMDLIPGIPVTDISIDRVFIGSWYKCKIRRSD